MSTAAACSTFNDIHFHDVTVHQDSSLQPSRTSHHKADRVKINKDIWSVFTNLSKIETYKGRDIRPIPSYRYIKCAKKLSAQTTSPTIDNFVLLLKVTPDYYSKKHCGELNFVDRFPPSQILMIWILLLHEIKIKWNGVKYNIFSVSTNDDNETTMMWLSCVIIQLFPRVLSTPIPDPILHFISKWDSDCVIEFSSLVQAQTRSFVIILQISPHLYKGWPLPPLQPGTPPSSALDHESHLAVRSYTQLHSAIHAAAGPAPPLLLARAELNQFKVCSVIAEEMGQWRPWMYILYIMDAQVGLKTIALTLFWIYFSISFLQLLCVMISDWLTVLKH